MHQHAAWITGIGAATPMGNHFDLIADNLLAGRSATRTVLERHGDEMVPCVGTVVDTVPAPAGFDTARFAALPKLQQMAIWCSLEALRDAQLLDHCQGLRVGVVMGLAGEWYRVWEADRVRNGTQLYQPHRDQESLVAFIQQQLGLDGPTASVGAACASANYALAMGKRWIEQGLVDVCLAGSCEIVSPITRACFNNLRALSRRFDDAAHASRPFDLDRDGFAMGEGAVIFALESAASAQRRGAKVYAEVAGFGASSDASHMIIPSDDPHPAAAAMRAALASAHAEPHEVDYVNAHATGTLVGDRAEARALKLVLGSHTASTPVSATKSMTGHLVSAAAAIEAVACITAIRERAVPPTINLDRPDPECDLCHVPNVAIERAVRLTLSNSFGFGGNNTTLILRQAG